MEETKKKKSTSPFEDGYDTVMDRESQLMRRRNEEMRAMFKLAEKQASYIVEQLPRGIITEAVVFYPEGTMYPVIKLELLHCLLVTVHSSVPVDIAVALNLEGIEHFINSDNPFEGGKFKYEIEYPTFYGRYLHVHPDSLSKGGGHGTVTEFMETLGAIIAELHSSRSGIFTPNLSVVYSAYLTPKKHESDLHKVLSVYNLYKLAQAGENTGTVLDDVLNILEKLSME